MEVLPTFNVFDDLTRDGIPRKGTQAQVYLQNEIMKAEQRGFNKGVSTTFDFLAKKYIHAVWMDFDKLAQTRPLPECAKEFEKVMECLLDIVAGMKTQINNFNKTNFREGTRAIILRNERKLGLRRGTIISTLLRDIEKDSYNEKRGRMDIHELGTAGNIAKGKRNRAAKEALKRLENPEEIELSDLLLNDNSSEEEEENTETINETQN